MSGTLHVPDGWRKTVLDWRMSVSQGNVGAYPSFFPLALNAQKRQQHDIRPGTIAVEPSKGSKTTSPAFAAGLRGNDVVTAVGGESPDVAGRGFLVWFKMRYERGDDVSLTVKDPQGRERTVSYRLAE
jgi:C-terminal processing protease CtpA/Prc